MTNKLTVLGLVAATAFIFTSCTKDNDTSLNDRLIAPVATLDAPNLKGGSDSDEAEDGPTTPTVITAPPTIPALTSKLGNEYEEADNGLSIPSIETAPVAEPSTTAPIWNSANRYQEYYMGVKETPNLPTSPVNENASGFRYQQYYMGVKDAPITHQLPPVSNASADKLYGIKNPNPLDPMPSEPNLVPHTWMDAPAFTNSANRMSGNGDLPDCTFPVVATQNKGNSDL